jgi:phage terminase large subunit GpA-like protein
VTTAPTELLERAKTSRRAYREAFLRGLAPDPRITVSEWADRHRQLTSRSSAEPGPWRTARTPYLREVMDCLSSTSSVEIVILEKGSQLGGTEVGNNWIGYVIDHCPGPMLVVMPTEKVQKRKSRQTLDALIEDTPRLAAKVSARKSRDPGNTTLLKVFPGGMLVLGSAESPADLRTMAARFLFEDELDAYPDEIEGEGDPDELAERATHTFRNRKILKVSTPTVEGRSRIHRQFLETDRRYYHVPCPHCGTSQRIEWKRIRWEAKDDELPERVALELRERRRSAWLECEACARRIDEHEKDKMLAAGVWIPEDPSLGERVRGYHLSALYSPFGMYSWTQSVARFLRAQGHPSRLRVWVNQDLGETWKEKGDAPEWRRLFELRENYPIGKVPRGGVLLTAGVDLQADRIEYEVVAWGPGLEAWSVLYQVRPYDPEKGDWRTEVDRLLVQTFAFADGGAPARLAGVAVDTGYEASKVYAWARRYGRSARLFLVKGRTGSRSPVDLPVALDVEVGGRRIKRGVRVWPVDTGVLKEELYDSLQLRPPVEPGTPYPEGFCHFPQYGAEFFKGLTAEVLVRRRLKGGRVILDWEKTRERNEPLDCRVYARAAAYILGADRWSGQDWKAVRELVTRLAAPPELEASPSPEPEPPPPPEGRRRQGSRWDRFRRPT